MSTTAYPKGNGTHQTRRHLLAAPRCVYEFGSFRVDPKNYKLTKDTSEIALPRKAFDLLLLLIQHRDQVIDRGVLLEILWSETIVEEANLTQTIYLLRKSLGPQNKFIETVPKRGYRFRAEVREVYVPLRSDASHHQSLLDVNVDGATLAKMPQVREAPRLLTEPLPTRRRVARFAWGGSVASLLLAGLLVYQFQKRDQSVALVDQIFPRSAVALSTAGKQNPVKRQTNSPGAYEAYMRGIYFWNRRNEEGYRKSLEYFEEAIRQDPNYALAYAALADTEMLVGHYDYASILPREEALRRARVNVLKALELDGTSAEAYTTLAFVKAVYERDIPAAREALETALILNPNYATAHHRYGIALQEYNPEKGLKHLQTAQHLDPVSSQINADLATAYYYNHDYNQMMTYARKALEINPKSHLALLNLGLALAQNGEPKEALVHLEKARRLTNYGDQIEILEAIGYIHAISGNRTKGLEIIRELGPRGPSLAQVVIYIGLGEKDKALDLLERVFNLHRAPPGPSMFCNDPRFDLIRTDPRFKNLMQRYRTQGSA